MKPPGSVVRGEMNFGTRRLKILDACGEVCGSHPIEQADMPSGLSGWPAAIASRPEQITHDGQERCLPDPSSHQTDMIQLRKVRKAISERPPRLNSIARLKTYKESGKLANYEVNDVDCKRQVPIIEDR